MANDYDTTARNLMLDALGAVAVRVAAHTGDPGGANSASNEITGGSPAYARGTIAWSAASGGAAAQNGNVVLDIPAGSTVSWLSLWNSAGTVRYLKKDVTDEAFGAQGTYTIVAASSSIDLNDA
jgi:alkylated DNA nucleotide flippase Atl1